MAENKNLKYASSFKEQFTTRAMVIGVIGVVIVTCSSMFVALKASSLPFPIMFVALVSMFTLKFLGSTNINEINVTHTAMSAGAMVAGGVAFTIPAIYMLYPDTDLSLVKLLIITISGTLLGLIFTSLMRKQFIETSGLPYAMGQAAAETLKVGDGGGKKAGLLFSSLGIAAIWTLLRDFFMKVPAYLWFTKLAPYGSAAGIWWSPMLISVGYLVGPLFIGVWFIGGIIGDFGILVAGQELGIFDAATALNVKSSLGLGLMVGTGVGIFIKNVFPNFKNIFGSMVSKDSIGDSIIPLRWAPILMVIFAVLYVLFLDLPVIAAIVTIIGVWLATAMSCQTVGMSAINPMEVFGIFILIIASILAPSTTEITAIYIAAIVAVACGLVGDVMNDFKAGHILNTDPKAQWIGELIGGLVGAVVSAVLIIAIVTAYGPSAFGNTELFPAAQASAVAAMAGGIAHVPAFVVGVVVAAILYVLGFYPVMTLGLGVYLPTVMTFTAAIGAVIRFTLDRACPNFEKTEKGTIIAAGLLGGEAIIGVVIAIILALQFVL